MLKKLAFLLFWCVIGFFVYQEIIVWMAGDSMKIPLLKEMFSEMVEKKNASLIPEYYHEDFMLYTNGQEMNYQDFLSMHEDVYKTSITYNVEYDEDTLLEQGSRVAGRVFITTQMPGEDAKEIEVMLIAEYKNHKLYRLWELTYPDWSKEPEFSRETELA